MSDKVQLDNLCIVGKTHSIVHVFGRDMYMGDGDSDGDSDSDGDGEGDGDGDGDGDMGGDLWHDYMS